MTQQTYEILPRTQYDPNGVSVGHNRLWAAYDANGNHLSGTTGPVAHLSEISAAVIRVATTRTAETITIGEPEPVVERGPLYQDDWCNDCYNPRRQCECYA